MWSSIIQKDEQAGFLRLKRTLRSTAHKVPILMSRVMMIEDWAFKDEG
jgi:hypothetical protein